MERTEKNIKNLLKKFYGDIEYNQGGSFDIDSVEYEYRLGDKRGFINHKLYNKRAKAMAKFEEKLGKTLDNLVEDYKKAWGTK